MATTEQTFLLVEITHLAEHGPLIARVIRSYLSNGRALDDLELLQETQAEKRYQVIEAPHIDD